MVARSAQTSMFTDSKDSNLRLLTSSAWRTVLSDSTPDQALFHVIYYPRIYIGINRPTSLTGHREAPWNTCNPPLFMMVDQRAGYLKPNKVFASVVVSKGRGKGKIEVIRSSELPHDFCLFKLHLNKQVQWHHPRLKGTLVNDVLLNSNSLRGLCSCL